MHAGRVLFKLPINPREFQENARRYGRFSRDGRRNEKNVGKIGLRGNYYDADFLAFRTRIGSLKKNATSDWHLVFFLQHGKVSLYFLYLFLRFKSTKQKNI